MKKGFTIIELMVVISIIGVLLGLVTNAAASSIKQARVRKASACCRVVEQGLTTYYAQKGKWPGTIGSSIASGSIRPNDNNLPVYNLSSGEIDSMIAALIEEARKGNTLMDFSGLYVSRNSGERNSKNHGLDFMEAIRGSKRSKKKMKVAEMHFGYPEADHGYFRNFSIQYSIPSDTMKVSTQQ